MNSDECHIFFIIIKKALKHGLTTVKQLDELNARWNYCSEKLPEISKDVEKYEAWLRNPLGDFNQFQHGNKNDS